MTEAERRSCRRHRFRPVMLGIIRCRRCGLLRFEPITAERRAWPSDPNPMPHVSIIRWPRHRSTR